MTHTHTVPLHSYCGGVMSIVGTLKSGMSVYECEPCSYALLSISPSYQAAQKVEVECDCRPIETGVSK